MNLDAFYKLSRLEVTFCGRFKCEHEQRYLHTRQMVDVSSCTDATAAMLQVCGGVGGFVWFWVVVYM